MLSKEESTSEQELLVKEILNYFADLIINEPTIYVEYMPNEKLRKRFPSGYINLGVAHGILGPLYVLALGFEKFNITKHIPSIEKGLSYYENAFFYQYNWKNNWLEW